jgi:hypothetical protein
MRRPFIHHGKAITERMSPTDIQRFLAFVFPDANGCWIWKGATDEKGYGCFWLNGRKMWATRVSYANFKCRLRDGNDVHHTRVCKSHSCVHPDHLAQRSRDWNSRDGGRRRHRAGKREKAPF